MTFDDPHYIHSVDLVRQGLSWKGLRFAWRGPHADNWHPLTTLSHMLDVELFGVEAKRAGGHLALNILLHAGTTVLLFRVLARATGAWLPAALAAALFGLHPLRVESVTWVSERKDVLSGLLAMLTLGAYLRFAQRPGWRGSVHVSLLLALGLMAKPTLVTLPFVFLLFDYWPLRRFGRWETVNLGHRPGVLGRRASFSQLLLEKLPFFVIVTAAAGRTLEVQSRGGAVQSLASIPLEWRLLNVPVAYLTYVVKTLWPTDLAAFYPHPATLPDPDLSVMASRATAATATLVIATLLALRLRRSRPYVIVGWLWFLGVLVPMIGFVQVGSQAYADRYTYLPTMGLAIIASWFACELAGRSQARRATLTGLAGCGLLALSIATWRQVGVWRSSLSLYEHGTRVVEQNFVLAYNLGNEYLELGRPADAALQYQAVIAVRPEHAQAHNNLGSALLAQGSLEAAADAYQRAIHLRGGYAAPVLNIGVVLERQGDWHGAWRQYKAALRIDPSSADAQVRLGRLLSDQQLPAFALPHLEQAVRARPGDVESRLRLADALAQTGSIDAAAAQYRTLLDHRPDLGAAREALLRLGRTP